MVKNAFKKLGSEKGHPRKLPIEGGGLNARKEHPLGTIFERRNSPEKSWKEEKSFGRISQQRKNPSENVTVWGR